jgi:hypothetical protein
MNNDLEELYKGRKIEIHLAGHGAGKHTRVLVNSREVTSHVPMPRIEPGDWNPALVVAEVRKLIDSGEY